MGATKNRALDFVSSSDPDTSGPLEDTYTNLCYLDPAVPESTWRPQPSHLAYSATPHNSLTTQLGSHSYNSSNVLFSVTSPRTPPSTRALSFALSRPRSVSVPTNVVDIANLFMSRCKHNDLVFHVAKYNIDSVEQTSAWSKYHSSDQHRNT
jgi:hypothetical protein